jgi:GAF domain-containing protein
MAIGIWDLGFGFWDLPMIHAHSLLATLARLVTDASALDVTLSRVAVLLREAIPFERLRVLRLDRADAVTLYVISASGEIDITGYLIGDAPSAAEDAADGVERSRLICTIRQGTRVKGAVWLTSSAPDAFTEEHQALLEAVGDLITLALYHDTVRTTELRRRERIDALVRLLQTVAETLDIRQIFPQLSDTVRAALPHDILALTAWARTACPSRFTRWRAPRFPTSRSGDRRCSHRSSALCWIARRTSSTTSTARLPAETIRGRLLRMVGARSALRVAIPLGSSVFGSLFFLAREPGRFSEEDVDFARRIADHLALALSHQHLAEAERRDAAARETACTPRSAGGDADARARSAFRPAAGRRPLASVAGCARAGRARRAGGNDGAVDRRVRHGQGSHRAVHSSRVAAEQRPLHRDQLRRPAGSTARIRALRLRAGRVHRCGVGQTRSHRAGKRWSAVSRRSW